MSDATSPDEFAAETARIFNELDEAKAAVVGNPAPNPFAKARADRAMVAAQQHRRMLRQVGQFYGDRAYPTDEELAAGVDPDMIIGLATADNSDAPLPTITQEDQP